MTQKSIGFILSAALLAIVPCMAQPPPGVLYSTTVPYSIPPTATSPPIVGAIATDASGNTYVTGSVYSNGLPSTPGVVQPAFAGGPDADAFVAKFDSSGTLVFLTYLGGTGGGVGTSIAVDASGDIYVGGTTSSSDFPLDQQGCQVNQCTFVAKLSGDGKSLIWSTSVLGTSGQLALAPDDSTFVLSQTVIMEVVAGNSVEPSVTEFTGSGQEEAAVVPSAATALVVGSDGSVYTGGSGFVAKMNSSLSGNTWLTHIGGNGTTAVSLIVSAPDGSLWAAGSTTSTDFPVLPGALQPQPSPYGSSGFLVHLSADGSQTLASTYLPSPPTSLTLDMSGNPIVNAPYQGALQATAGAQWPCEQPTSTGYAGFIGKLDSTAQHVLWGTSTGPSVPIGPATVDSRGNAVVAGTDVNGNLILAALSTTSVSPRLVESCITSAVHGSALHLAPGELFSIYGAGFGPAQGIAAQSSGNKIGTELGGLQVTVEGTAVPLLYVSSAQINLVAPFLLDGRTAAHIKIVTPGATSNEVVLGVQEAVPEIFAIVNQDGTVNSQAHPAHAGDVLSMWLSGVGQTNPPGVDGVIPTAASGTPVLPIEVRMQSVPSVVVNATVTYAGNAPGLVSGVAQVNFEMPRLNPPVVGISGPPVPTGPPYSAGFELSVGATPNPPHANTAIWFE
jgi:uncharacterized protein (TIGR03437 family)